jgi:hemoglobin-like flavoprotein
MNRRQADQLVASFRWFEPCGAALVAKVFRNLQDYHPNVRALFPEETEHLNGRFFRTLAQVVLNIHRFHALQQPLAELGRDAEREGANIGHYRIIRGELLSVMAELAADDWTEQIEALWRETLDAMTGAMLSGTGELRKAA